MYWPFRFSLRVIVARLYFVAERTDMKVFISWSGHRSHEVAEALSGWLRKVIQSAEPWVSSDVERGVKWLAEIGKSLDAHSIGILCVTPGNVTAPWLNFEAGALSKQLGETGRVIPYLLDFRSPSELQPPLGQFNASLADELGTHNLVKTLNAHSESKLSDTDLNETFKMWWPKLRDKLEAIRTSGSGHPPKRRTADDKLDELLDLTRQLMRQMPALQAADERYPSLLASDIARMPSSSAEELIDYLRVLARVGSRGPSDPLRTNLDRAVGLSGEGNLGGPARELAKTQVAYRVIVEGLRRAGVDENAIKAMSVNDQAIGIFVSSSVDESLVNALLHDVRETLRALPGEPPRVILYKAETTEEPEKMSTPEEAKDAHDGRT